ncbi:hypothetical protein SBRCBS47491_003080 [Sporothrix bragantina]|uniref:Myb-like DNA-binding domain-containing protein n=1 Tax=Sporothrix bragantina TaxID=671064 RepID=A0ABP0BC25_9PEZI
MSAAEQVSFLLVCIKHATSGKIDFDAVATELKIPTKAATAKRYERLKKRALATDFGSCTAAVDGTDPGSDNAVATTKPKRTPAKPRAKGKAAAATAGPADDSAPDASGEASASAATTVNPNTPRPTKRKRTTADIAGGEDAPAVSQPDAGQDANFEAAASYTGSHFIAVNSSPDFNPLPEHMTVIRKKAEAGTAKLCNTTATANAINTELVVNLPAVKSEDATDDGI